MGDPEPGFVTTPVVALLTIAFRTVVGEAVGKACLKSAATPATWGEAIEVPLIVRVAVFEVDQAEVIDEPGAKRSRQVPIFENDERASVEVVEPTVIARGALAGDELQALALLLPAATTMLTPELCRLAIAESSAEDAPPPRLIFATDLADGFEQQS